MKFSLFWLLSVLTLSQSGILYLNGLYEHQDCPLESLPKGVCRKVTDCQHEFESYKRNETTLRICSYEKDFRDNLICCPIGLELQDEITAATDHFENMQLVVEDEKLVDYTDYESCLSRNLKYRAKTISTSHLAVAMLMGKIPVDANNCRILNKLNEESKSKNQSGKISRNFYKCMHNNGNYELQNIIINPNPIKSPGWRPNMAALGWILQDRSIDYKCFGSIISTRFVITAARCKFDGRKADIVRVGDRYLKSTKDDEHAQVLQVEVFLNHPQFVTSKDYNDIALVKTLRRIIFNEFVAPACIGDFHPLNFSSYEATVSGYGEELDEIPSNVLMELNVELVSNRECANYYDDDIQLPRGIINSQFCVISRVEPEDMPDTCFGDEGSPIQYKNYIDIPNEDFETTFLSTIHHSDTILGILSFKTSCDFEVPAVYTKLSHFRDWIKETIENN